MDQARLSLWSVLSIEEDLLISVLKQLDPTSLKNTEATCSQFRGFVKRANLWKVVFNHNYPGFLEKVENEDVFKRLGLTMGWDDHFKYKRLSLKVSRLKENWLKKCWTEKHLDLRPVFGSEVIKAIKTDLIVSVSSNAFFSRISNVFDLSKWRRERHEKVQFSSEMHILSADIATEHIVLFGEPKVRDFNFHLQLLSRPDLRCVKESQGLNFEVATQRSLVKLTGSWLVLFQSFLGEESIVNNPRDTFHFFSFKNPGPFLVHCRKLVLDLPAKKFLRLTTFDHEYAAGVRRSGGLVHVWAFKDLLVDDKVDNDLQADDCVTELPSLWTRDLGNRNTVTITALALAHPLLVVGKSSGCCEVWDLGGDWRVANLHHGAGGTTCLLPISRIIILPSNILTLTHRGRVFVWERMNLDKRDLKEKPSKPLWTLEEERKGEQVKDMVATSTKLVLIRQSSITSLDFWEEGHRVREVFKPEKVPTTKPTSASKSKSTLAPEILGKRRLARESTKVKRRCCAFC